MTETRSAADPPRSRRAPTAVNQTRPRAWIERAELLGTKIAIGFLSLFSPKWKSRIAGALGGGIGGRLWFARRAETNLSRFRPALGASERRGIVRRLMSNFARTGVEYLDLPDLARRAEGFEVEGLEHLHAARAAAGGRLVVVSAHFGNWEAIRAVAAREGAPLAIIYRAFNNQLIDALFFDLIVSAGWRAFRKGAVGGRELLRHVRSGEGALILIDQRAGGAPRLDFMGAEAETSLAAAQLSRTLRAPMLPAVAFREGDGFKVRFEAPIEGDNPVEMMQEANRRIASWIDDDPGQWFWLHRRWRIRGGDAPPISAGRTYTPERGDE